MTFAERASFAKDYYRLLLEVTQYGAREPWTLYMLDAMEQTASSTVAKISAIRTTQSEMHDAARLASPGGRNADFLAVLFEQPYCRIRNVMNAAGYRARRPHRGSTGSSTQTSCAATGSAATGCF